jgi:hypothetical protein
MEPHRAYWKEPTQANRNAIRSMVQPETTVWQYTYGVADPSLVSPDGYTLDNHCLARPGGDEIQLDLFLDYASNIDLYPEFQAYFQTRQPPLLAIWGRNDPFFLPTGADAARGSIFKPPLTWKGRWQPGTDPERRDYASLAASRARPRSRTAPIGASPLIRRSRQAAISAVSGAMRHQRRENA